MCKKNLFPYSCHLSHYILQHHRKCVDHGGRETVLMALMGNVRRIVFQEWFFDLFFLFVTKTCCRTLQMLKQVQMGVRAFLLIAAKFWNCVCYLLKKQVRTVAEHQPVKYQIFPLSPLSRHRLSLVKRKVLVLDLDETLIHSHHDGIVRPSPIKAGIPADFILKVTIDRHPVRFFVHKRPHVDLFLDIVSQWYELVVFTASMEIYGASVADRLDNNRGILRRRYYRQHCTPEMGSYTKDLSAICGDLSSIFILDNSPGAYRAYPDNAIPIKSWISDPTDTALLNLLPVLDALRFTQDVRSVLSRNLHIHRFW